MHGKESVSNWTHLLLAVDINFRTFFNRADGIHYVNRGRWVKFIVVWLALVETVGRIANDEQLLTRQQAILWQNKNKSNDWKHRQMMKRRKKHLKVIRKFTKSPETTQIDEKHFAENDRKYHKKRQKKNTHNYIHTAGAHLRPNRIDEVAQEFYFLFSRFHQVQASDYLMAENCWWRYRSILAR